MLIATLACGIASRVLLPALFPSLVPFLGDLVECSTPVSSFKRLQEGVFLFEHKLSPYDGAILHQSPLLLSLFSVFGRSEFLINCIYAFAEGMTALCLALIARYRPHQSFSPATTAAVYLFNPFPLLACLARSTNVFINSSLAASLAAAQYGMSVQSMAFLALATCLGLYPLYLVVPVIVLCLQNEYKHTTSRLVAVFLFFCLFFLGLSYLPVKSWAFLDKMYGTLVFYSDLSSPNLGLWWYLFIELFEFFRPFFLGVFQLFVAVFPLPLTIRFPHNPLFAIGCIIGLQAVFKPYPEVGDVGFYFSVLMLNKHVVTLMQYRLLVGLGLLHVCVLAPAFYHLWISVGSGNANFFYAITLGYTLDITLALADSIWAAIRLDYDGGKSPNLMQI